MANEDRVTNILEFEFSSHLEIMIDAKGIFKFGTPRQDTFGCYVTHGTFVSQITLHYKSLDLDSLSSQIKNNFTTMATWHGKKYHATSNNCVNELKFKSCFAKMSHGRYLYVIIL